MRALCTALLALSLSAAQCQYFTNHTEEDGLTGARVRCTVQDSSGYLWVATFDGLSRFDGGRFRNFTAADSAYGDVPQGLIDDVVVGPDGLLWVVSEHGGLCQYDPRTMRFTAWEHLAGSRDPEAFGLAHGLAPIAEDSLFAWNVSHGLVLYRPLSKQRTLIGFPDGVGASTGGRWIKRDPQRRHLLWIANKRGLFTWDLRTHHFTTHLLAEEGSMANVEGWSVDVLHFETDGSMRIGIRNRGLMRYHPLTLEWDTAVVRPSVNISMDAHSVFSMALVPEGLCIGTSNGLQIIGRNGEVMRHVVHEPGNPHSILPGRVFDLFVGRDGTLWASTSTGLSQWSPPQNRFAACSISQAVALAGKPVYTGAVETTDGLLLATSSGHGFLRMNGSGAGSMAHASTSGVLPGGAKSAIVDMIGTRANGTFLWTDRGLWKMLQGPPRISLVAACPTASLEQYAGAATLEDGLGRIYSAGALSGVWRTDPGQGLVEDLPFEPGRSSVEADVVVKGMAMDDVGRVWLAYFNKGLKMIAPDGTVRTWAKNDHAWLGDALIWDLECDPEGRLWMATKNNGLQWVRREAVLHDEVHAVERVQGVPTVAASIERVRSGALWVAGSMGLCRVDPRDMSVRRFGRADGLETDPFFTAEFMELEDGRLLITLTGRPPLLFHPDSIPLAIPSPAVVIERAIVNGEDRLALSARAHEGVRLTHDNNHLIVHFSAITFTHRDRVALEYGLEGSDDPMVTTAADGMATFTGLAPGRYRMVVRMAGAVDGKVLAALPIEVLPAYWQTWWFKVASLLIIAGVILFFYQRRLRQVRQQEQLRSDFEIRLAEVEMSALRAQMNPHFLFNSLNSINRYIVKNEPKLASEYLTKFSRLMRSVLNNSKQQVVPLQDELDALNLYIELESLRFNNRFELDTSVELDEDASTVMVPPMLLQPYVENAIWHGLMHMKEGVPKLKLIVRKSGGLLRFEVEDNGVGREQAALLRSKRATDTPSHGTRITRERLELVERLHGLRTKVEYIDLKDLAQRPCGTRVIITITHDQ